MEQESKGWTDEHEFIRSPKIQRKIKPMEDCRTTSLNGEEWLLEGDKLSH